MLTIYDQIPGGLRRRQDDPRVAPESLWIDLLNPTPEEEKQIEQALSLDIPTREELQEIEASSRLYQEDGAHFMTANLLIQINTPTPISAVVTFILTENQLVTVRYAEPYSFEMFAVRAQKGQVECHSACTTLVGLLEIVIDRQADLIERIQIEMDRLSHSVFGSEGEAIPKAREYGDVLKRVGREGNLTSRAREALHSLGRLLTYLSQVTTQRKDEKSVRGRIKTATRDVHSLIEHVNAISNQITFLLDATLGMINIEQNAIIKLFSVVAVALLPPTLVASIYGMNFRHMPELDWIWGYPMALGLMVISVALPLWYFRHRGWM